MPSTMSSVQVVAILFGLFSSGASALWCSVPEGTHYEVTSPADIPRLFSDCLEIWGDILITNSYSGAFDGWYHWDPDYSRAPNVTSIEIPDLQMIYSLVIQDIPTLTLISMPKLEEIWHGLSLLQRRNPPIEADFRALRWANDFGFDGLFTSVNLDSLEDVTNRLDRNNPECDHFITAPQLNAQSVLMGRTVERIAADPPPRGK
ncbi:hypothetical protein BJX62DRAFT_236360 [Aspergillus germanicus]